MQVLRPHRQLRVLQDHEHGTACLVGVWFTYSVFSYLFLSNVECLMKTRRLATANRSPVSIRGRPCKNFPDSLITIRNLVTIFHTVRARVRGPKNFGDAGAPPPSDGAWMTPRITFLSHMCYHIPNLVALGQTILAYVGSQIFWDAGALPLRFGDVATPLETCFSSTCFTVPNSVILRQTVRA